MVSSNVLASLFTGGDNDKDKGKSVAQPKDYKPSSTQERNNWNQFLDFLGSKGMGGNPELDKRDRTRGLELLNEFNKQNPKNKIDPSFIPKAQYESFMIRKQLTFPGLTPEQSNYAFSNLSPQFRNREISDVDNWLGSYTSKQYYPQFENVGDKNGNGKVKYGTDFESYIKAASSLEPKKPQPLPAGGSVVFLSK